jgi:RNA-splicing ligase RtcB
MNDTKIFATIVDDVTKKQVEDLTNSDAYKGCSIRIMPDCHAGEGCTIGTVINIGGRIVPNTVGVDIGCGMLVTKLDKQYVDLELLDEVINEFIPSGFNIHQEPKMHTHILDNLYCREAIDLDMAMRSIGSLGGGNHFIELDIDEQDNKYLVIHSGSRNLGKRVCEYWQKKAVDYCQRKAYDEKAIIEQAIIEQLKAEGRQNEIQAAIKEAKAKSQKINKELAYIEGEDAKHYIFDMQMSQLYASYNRNKMADIILEKMELHCEGQFTTLHNYIDIKHNILRKGAVSALAGEELLIPMNMRDGSLLCIGKGNLKWLYSAPHGAGRLMSRKQAKENIDMKEFEASMDGIFTTSVCEETIDEAPMVYKPMEEIVKCIEPTVDIVSIIKPLYNFKAKTPEEWWRKSTAQ